MWHRSKMAIVSQSLHDATASAASRFAPTPIVSAVMAVESAWIDYNGHLNMAYYHVFFDRALDELFAALGVGADYLAARNASMFALEAHVCYLREVKAGDQVLVETQHLDHDGKRLHLFQTLRHAAEGYVSATNESVGMHIDMAARRGAPFPAEVAERLAGLAAAHAGLALPDRAGRKIGLGR